MCNAIIEFGPSFIFHRVQGIHASFYTFLHTRDPTITRIKFKVHVCVEKNHLLFGAIKYDGFVYIKFHFEITRLNFME